ncbi:MAG: DnaJ domain-containing protein, partial [Succinivibrionaceae bacterium]|nr:DnaJ domain-containing protein [Succinivibrionaceae bacterium]
SRAERAARIAGTAGGSATPPPPPPEEEPDPDGTLEVFRLLGVRRTSTPEEIHHAYKRMLMRYHPDRMAANGVNPELKGYYNLKTEEVRMAYELIKGFLGIS